MLWVLICWIWIRGFIDAGPHQLDPSPGFIVAGPYLLDPDPGFIVAGAHQLDESRSGDSILRILLIKGILKNGLSNWFRAFFRDAAFHVRREKKIYFFNS